MGAITGWQEVGDRVWVRRYDPFDVNVSAIGTGAGLVVVDTRGSGRQGEELRADLGELDGGTVAALVNTHVHFDHCFGNEAFPGIGIWAHERCAARLEAEPDGQRQAALEWVAPDGREEVMATRVVAPDSLVGDSATVDVGGRWVELAHLGRGHTDNDLVVTIPDAAVVLAGDLVEQGAPPAFEDAWPLEWPDTVTRLLERVTGPVVPGHGTVVDGGFAAAQRDELAEVRQLAVAVLAGETSLVDAARRCPYPEHVLTVAVERLRVTRGS